jgi:hypothetical protein
MRNKVAEVQRRRCQKSSSSSAIWYNSARGVDEFVKRIANAAPMELIEIERGGVNAQFITDLAIQGLLSTGTSTARHALERLASSKRSRTPKPP